MTTLTIDLGARSYPIEIEQGLLSNDALFARFLTAGRPVIVITNNIVAPLYLEKLTQTLKKAGVIVHPVILPDGEAHKTSESLGIIYDEMLRLVCDRQTPIIALGGGVIGDLSGFAAATYQRGVPFIQVPTTLLSQVDSSVGGKTGINHPRGKNMIGAFYQPKLVVADINTLMTLSDRDYRSGIAEIIKYGLIADYSFFEWLEANMESLLAKDIAALDYAVYRSCWNKKQIVDQDEFEKGQRALLNLGHTFGHAIETGTGYGQWRHGEAVAAGMTMAADLSCRLGKISAQDVERIVALIHRAKLPILGPDLGAERYLEMMALDKKNQGGKLRLVLIDKIGKASLISDVAIEKVKQTLTACISDNPLEAIL